MKQKPRIYYTESQKALMRERWQKSEPLSKSPNWLVETTHRYKKFWPRHPMSFIKRAIMPPYLAKEEPRH